MIASGLRPAIRRYVSGKGTQMPAALITRETLDRDDILAATGLIGSDGALPVAAVRPASRSNSNSPQSSAQSPIRCLLDWPTSNGD
jgi:hypothetical protein